MRTPIIVGNWKMNNTKEEIRSFHSKLKEELNNKEVSIDFGIAPATSYLGCLNHLNNESGFTIPVSAQNVHFEDKGAFTGEISTDMLKDFNAKYSIIGHSERREMFAETNETVNKKAKKLLSVNITPIVAYGETEAEFDAGKTNQVINEQLKNSLEGLTAEQASKIVLAYEPIWAIGTGKTATPEQAQSACKESRNILKEMFGEEVSSKVRIQYGGSVNPSNVKELMSQEDIDGALVGGASLDAASFAQLITFNN